MTGISFIASLPPAVAQVCPANIDFETGTFDGWTCYTGYVTGNGTNIISLTPSPGPVQGRHTMYSSFPDAGTDFYGGFPVNCPNGSGHSIRLGNNFGGGEAEGISYEFTIPANQNYYTLIYNYAVVFQDPDHQEYQQPRLEIEVEDVTDNRLIYCSSFTFIPFGNILPGFYESANPAGETPVWCKDWTAVSINLDGHAGKTIRLFFKTADCTFQRHFGYAYIDVNSECSGTFTGATYCPDDSLINVVAPYGYQSYTWFNSSFTQVLGNQQVLTLQPPPPSGTLVAVELEPYAGYGCPDTLYAKLIDTLTVIANAGGDVSSCNNEPVPIGSPPKPGLVYRWSPTVGLSNANIANPYASPDFTTTYVLTVAHDGGGCVDTDTVTVQAAAINNEIELFGKDDFCLGSGDSAVLRVSPADSIQWYRNGIAINGATGTEYRVLQSGTYKAVLFNFIGCGISTSEQTISIVSIPEPAMIPPNLNQCLVGNRFGFTNTSTNALGAMQYLWSTGDGSTSPAKDLVYTYPKAGVYEVKLVVQSSPVCKDSITAMVNVYQNAIADFTAKPICIGLPFQPVNLTVDTLGSPISYLWTFGNGQTSTDRDPPAQIYTSPGNYSVSLSVTTAQCPSPPNILKRIIPVDKPRPAIEYPVKYAVIDYPTQLQARDFGATALWDPGVHLNNPSGFAPVFTGTTGQDYTITITTASGCVTVDTQVVKTVKEANIYVPAAFTPNNDGMNDRIYPILMGIRELRYFRIFNRWGELVYQSKTDLPGWDGNIAGKPQTSQVFVWLIEGTAVDDRVITRKGTFTLIR